MSIGMNLGRTFGSAVSPLSLLSASDSQMLGRQMWEIKLSRSRCHHRAAGVYVMLGNTVESFSSVGFTSTSGIMNQINSLKIELPEVPPKSRTRSWKKSGSLVRSLPFFPIKFNWNSELLKHRNSRPTIIRLVLIIFSYFLAQFPGFLFPTSFSRTSKISAICCCWEDGLVRIYQSMEFE